MIRDATIHDLEGIMALETSSFPDDSWSEQTMATEITSAHNRYLVEEEDGHVIGYGGVRALPGAPDSDIQTIALDPAFRGQGRGRRMLRLLLDLARERGARDTFLEVRDDNGVAQALYLSEGFVEIGRRPRYYKGGIDAIVMKVGLASGRVTEPVEASSGASGWGAEPVEASSGVGPSTSSGTQSASGSSGWGAEPVEASSDSSGWVAEPVEASPGSSGWVAEPVEALPGASGWVAEPVEASSGVGPSTSSGTQSSTSSGTQAGGGPSTSSGTQAGLGPSTSSGTQSSTSSGAQRAEGNADA